ncbi:MAG: hypothetical protein RLZZ450_5828 [Pseudomonadota bacterium]|jgi:hypothetical protein
MKHGSGARSPEAPASPNAEPRAKTLEVRESGIVPARGRGVDDALAPAVTLRASRVDITHFGDAVAGAGDILLIGSRIGLGGDQALEAAQTVEGSQPFVILYRITDEGVVRERVLRGAVGHESASLATDGRRVAVGQPAPEGGLGSVSVYVRTAGELTLESRLEPRPQESLEAEFGQKLALAGDLLVVGQPASVRVYRHSAVGWLSAGPLRPALPYEWNPALGQSLGVLHSRVLVGNPIEIDGHRAGPGRVFVYKQADDHVELDCELTGDGIEGGREETPRAGFGASIQVSEDFVLVSAPFELSPSGSTLSRVYVFRSAGGSLTRFASLDVPSCHGGVCMVGERLFVLGDALYVYARAGNGFTPVSSYPLSDASQTTLASCGKLLAIATQEGASTQNAGQVSLHFPEHL